MADAPIPHRPPAIRTVDVSPSAVLAALALAALVFVPALETLGAAGFLGFGALLILRQPRRILAEHLRHAPIYALPAFCIASALWSAEPEASLRYGLQLALTVSVAVAIACKVSAESFVRIALAVHLAAALASLAAGSVRDDGAWLGVFASKNAFAAVMGTLALLSACLLADRAAGVFWRLAALTGLALGVFLLVMAQSAGAILVTAAAVTVIPAVLASARLPPGGRLLAAITAVILVLLAFLAAAAFREPLTALLLDATGKDITLTGRTEMWRLALDLIAERPLLGSGFQAFWVHGNPEAEMLWEAFGITERAGFNFHNTWLNNAVEIGLLGVAIQAALVVAALSASFRWALGTPRSAPVFFAAFLVQILVTSMVEVVVFFQFNPRTVILLAALVYARHALSAPRAVSAFPPPRPDGGRPS